MTFTASERRVIRQCRTPASVQQFLNALPYNTEPPPDPATLRSFRGVVRHRTANCIEAALSAAVILEQHGYPPLVMSLESIDQLDHVIFVYRHRGRWGSVARSRDLGLHGRRPVFSTPRHLARSYFDPFVDFTGRLKAYALVDLRVLGTYDWRLSERNVWKVETYLLNVPHRPIASSDARVRRLRARYVAFRKAHPGMQPDYYDQRTWTELPNLRNPSNRSNPSNPN
ncbi:MAG TPA: hypothetical protein VJN96_14990 [Vicinamibacterales bacterium]|nr:hypothetical protein [Vicinamibacterales bacterium]